MLSYIIRRLILLIPIMLGVSLIAFSIMHLTPEDPIIKMLGEGASEELVSELRAELGLDDPIHIQYFAFLERFFIKAPSRKIQRLLVLSNKNLESFLLFVARIIPKCFFQRLGIFRDHPVPAAADDQSCPGCCLRPQALAGSWERLRCLQGSCRGDAR